MTGVSQPTLRHVTPYRSFPVWAVCLPPALLGSFVMRDCDASRSSLIVHRYLRPECPDE